MMWELGEKVDKLKGTTCQCGGKGKPSQQKYRTASFNDELLAEDEIWDNVMNPPLPVVEPLMLLFVAYLAWSLELD